LGVLSEGGGGKRIIRKNTKNSQKGVKILASTTLPKNRGRSGGGCSTGRGFRGAINKIGGQAAGERPSFTAPRSNPGKPWLWKGLRLSWEAGGPYTRTFS